MPLITQDDSPPETSDRVRPIKRITEMVNALRGAGDSNQTAASVEEIEAQLSLFPAQRLYPVPNQPGSPNRRPIKLPRSVLVILPNELLTNYLSRVAAAAMSAATKSYGSAALATFRLGTADEDPEAAAASRPKLTLATKPQKQSS